MTYKTEKRKEILQFLTSVNNPATIEEICDAILTDGSGKSTVYRLVSRLVDEGALRRIADAKTRRVTYQYISHGACSEHLHLKCKDCGRLIHLDNRTSSQLGEEILRTRGFSLDLGALLYGRCERCVYAKKEGAK